MMLLAVLTYPHSTPRLESLHLHPVSICRETKGVSVHPIIESRLMKNFPGNFLAADPREFLERTIGFTINYTREDPHDPRELSELPNIRLWFVRLDAIYPWLPVVLDWRAGELARYAAMLVPHQVLILLCVGEFRV